jgi:catechol 2,3-dioxygenase-like lactoylglutathione lyase family enzyme
VVALSIASLFVRDVEQSAEFYRTVFGLTEVREATSPHFRGLQVGETVLGFHGPHAYELLRLDRPTDEHVSVHSLLTFEAADPGEVDRLTGLAVDCGATVLKAPGQTYYGPAGPTLVREPGETNSGAWQSVLADPDGNVFRISCMKLESSP